MMPSPNKTTIKTISSKRVTSNEKIDADYLKKFMNKHGVSDKELGELLGVTPQAVKLWLNGSREFSITNSRLIRLFEKYPNLIGEF